MLLTVIQSVVERAAANSAESNASDAMHNAIGKSLSELSKAHETVNRFVEITHPESAVAGRPPGLYQIAKRTTSVLADSALRRRMTIAVKNMDVAPLMAVLPREGHVELSFCDTCGGIRVGQSTISTVWDSAWPS